MKLRRWARLLLTMGLLLLAVGAGPALLFSVLPAALSDGFFGLLAVMLSFTVAPLGLVVLSAGAVLLVLALGRNDRA